MESNHNTDETPLYEGLDTIPREAFELPESSNAFRERVLARTTAQVRKRAKRSLGMRMFLSYGAGVATVLLFVAPAWWTPKHTGMQEQPVVTKAPADPPSAPKAGAILPRELLHDSEALAFHIAAASKADRLRILKQAGDGYLNEWGDPQRATQCYGRLLDLTGKNDGYSVETTDSWLLATLKRARQKEISDVPSSI